MNSLKKQLLYLYRAFNRNLKVLEALQVRNPSEPLPYPVVFILGAPRSGTTLVYQALTSAFDFSYFSNSHCRLFGAPWLIEKIMKPSDKYQQSSFRSRFGVTEGWKSPSECGEFWYRFFPRRPQYVTLEKADPKKLTELRTAIHAFQKASEKTLLIKNLPCSFRLNPILKTLPEAIFVIVRRDETDTAHSILESRKKYYGSYDEWFSLEPPNFEQLSKLSPHVQVVEQIRAVYREIRQAEQDHGARKFFTVSFEEFCNTPNEVLDQVLAFFRIHDFYLTKKSEIPDSFERRKGVRIDKDLYDKLWQYVKENSNDE